MSWSAGQYRKFETERNRPIHDLLGRIPAGNVCTAVDIGCGPGNSTELLRNRFPEAAVSGMDSSPDMIDAARKRLPTVQFDVANIGTWTGNGPFDLIFANAALQWVPDHESLFPRLLQQLTPGGSLAVQMPDNADEPAHRLMREIADRGAWAEKLAPAKHRLERKGADWYYKLLVDRVSELDIWRTTYYHPLAGGAAAVVEWFKGTGLRPYLDPLSQEEQHAFLEQYQQEIALAYPALADGTVLLPFPRLFIVAVL
ncbi:trans-aconitate 2-methyltransferase [Spirosoma sp. KUDC1026]|uniref:trans-aconitate 2-methyltransferase n=1 Tax=Spirosoma sp. KUDC1026 TaxID=2745947 RepID=UPI00159B9F10|nr:trans-aconitate 2-methyltransferase [Spirosoma sp. KUDC1026]QKZ14391.1 trans-aconitate 2-methyltransferase [Spirosoma sp. KUDC1026]